MPLPIPTPAATANPSPIFYCFPAPLLLLGDIELVESKTVESSEAGQTNKELNKEPNKEPNKSWRGQWTTDSDPPPCPPVRTF